MKKFGMLLVLATLAMASWKKEEVEEPDPVADKLKVALSHVWLDGAFVYDQTYTIGDVPIIIQEFRYFLSNFESHDDADNKQEFTKVLLVDAAIDQVYIIGELDYSYVHEVHLALGLDETTNHEDPTLADSPLNDGTMHWGWAPEEGYKFIRIEGQSDADLDGTFESFSIHAATDELYRTMEWDINETAGGGEVRVPVIVDIYKFLQNVDFTQTLVGTHGSSDLTNGIADDGTSNAFSVD